MSHILWVCVAKNLGWCKNRGHPPSQALGLRMHSMHEDWSMVRKQKHCPSWAPTDSLNTWDTPPQQMTVHGLARWLRIWHKIPWKLHKSRSIEAPKKTWETTNELGYAATNAACCVSNMILFGRRRYDPLIVSRKSPCWRIIHRMESREKKLVAPYSLRIHEMPLEN